MRRPVNPWWREAYQERGSMRVTRVTIASLLLTLLAAACQEQETTMVAKPTSSPPAAAEEAATLAQPTETATRLNIGDAQAKVYIEATISGRSIAENIRVKEMEARNRTSLVIVDVYPPYPDELVFDYELRTQAQFPRSPLVVRLRPAIKEMDGKPTPDGGITLSEIAYVFGASARGREEHEVQVDLMPALETPPKTLLIVGNGEGLLMPMDTPKESVDPVTATTAVDRQGPLDCNPIRVNFHGPDETP
jgi:hypothetical protein